MNAEELRLRILADRRFTHEADGITFRLLRPTEFSMTIGYPSAFAKGDLLEWALKHIEGADGLKQRHVIDGGSDDPVPFDAMLVLSFMADHMDITLDLVKALSDRYEQRKERLACQASAV